MCARSEMDISGYLTGSTMPKLTQDNMKGARLDAAVAENLKAPGFGGGG